MKYKAIKCACGHPSCNDWHVSDVADVQGVHFTEEQATVVAEVLNTLDLPLRIRDALGTEERGEALVDVARNAHKAELELATAIVELERLHELLGHAHTADVLHKLGRAR